MCRLYGQISPTAQSAKDFLVDADRSLLRQSDYRQGFFQKDGWGVGFFDQDHRARIVKSPKPIFEEPGRFTSLVAKIRSRVVIGHLRAATNPLGLPKRRLLATENSQPFTDGRFIFAHNGSVDIPLEVAKFLGPYRDRVRGLNDSEIYFWQFRKFYDVYGDVPKALQACIRELWTIWDYCRSRYPKRKYPYTGLNALVSDGSSLHALCHRSRPSKHISLFNPRQNWATMSFARRDGRMILASEDLDTGSWSHFRESEIISATLSSSGVSVRRQRFQIHR